MHYYGLCEMVTFLKENPEVYREQYELALQNIEYLIRSLPKEELDEVLKVEEDSTDKVAEVPLREVFAPDRRN